jgi:crotonobetainyl-CoA:carnitine CoA-transferase CaiB-like acyl-CoA transferase
MQAAVSGLANQATNYLNTGHVPRRMGSAHPNIAPYGTAYATADTPVVLAVGTDRQFAALCTVLGCPAQAEEKRFATNAARVQHREALDEALRPRLAEQSADALLEALHQRGVPAGAVRGLPAVFNAPHTAAMMLGTDDATHPAGLRQTMPGAVGCEKPLAPPPHYAADTVSVLEAKGYSEAEIGALEDGKIIQTA